MNQMLEEIRRAEAADDRARRAELDGIAARIHEGAEADPSAVAARVKELGFRVEDLTDEVLRLEAQARDAHARAVAQVRAAPLAVAVASWGSPEALAKIGQSGGRLSDAAALDAVRNEERHLSDFKARNCRPDGAVRWPPDRHKLAELEMRVAGARALLEEVRALPGVELTQQTGALVAAGETKEN